MCSVYAKTGRRATLGRSHDAFVFHFAAARLALTMLGAMATHFRRREYPNLVPNVALLLLAIFIAYGRWS